MSVKEGVKLITDVKPDLVFLDIQLPPYTGFDLLIVLHKEVGVKPEIIFVIAYDDFALQAIKFNAIDYVLKPIDTEVLNSVIQNFLNKSNIKTDKDLRINNTIHYFNKNKDERIVLSINGGFKVVKLANVLYC